MMPPNDSILEHINNLLESIRSDDIQKIVVAAIVNKDSSVLFLKRAKKDYLADLVELPSGGVNAKENLIDALARELKEETNLDLLAIKKYIGSFDYISKSGKKTRQLNFSVTVKNDDVHCDLKEHSEYYWIPAKSSKLDQFNISINTKEIILSMGNSPL